MIYRTVHFLKRAWNKLISTPIRKTALGHCGKNVTIGSNFKMYGSKNISLGNNVAIGDDALFMCTRAKIKIGDNVMFAPRVTLITGGHKIDLPGRYMISVTNEEKNPNDDRDIILEGDIWVGANVTILRGTTIGQGSVIAAGSVVTKDVPPFTIVGGVPAKFIKMRFDEETLKQHLSLLDEKQKK